MREIRSRKTNQCKWFYTFVTIALLAIFMGFTCIAMTSCSVKATATSKSIPIELLNFQPVIGTEDQIELTGIDDSNPEINLCDTLTVPATCNYHGANYKITKIAVDAFSLKFTNSKNSNIKKLNLTDAINLSIIAAGAFAQCSSLTGILTIPQTVTNIGVDAFMWCDFDSVQFIDGTASLNISEEAFINCTKLSGELNIIDRITNIGINAFLRTKFSDISIGSNNVNYALAKNVGAAKVVIAINTNNGNLDYAGSLNNVIGSLAVGQLTIQGSPDAFKDGLFYCCQGLTGQLTIPNSITTIGERAFGGCIGLVGNLVIPDTVTTIGNLAFEYCSGLNGAITIGQSVSTIGKQAFAAVPINNINNRSTNFVFANNVGNARVLIPANTNNGSLDYATNINDVVGKLAYGSLTIPNDVTTIKEDLFSTCYGMNGMLTFGNNVTTINQRAFLGCRFSGALTLPNSLIVIANGVFEGCTNFNGTLFLPDSITTIEPFAFNGCKNFKVIDVTTWTSLPAISNQAFLQWSSTGTIYVPPNNPLNISYSTFKSLSSGWVTVIK